MALPWTTLTAALTLTLAGCASIVPGAPASEAIPTRTSTQAQQRPAGPPVGDTVNVTLALADSLNVNADGTCSGGSDNAGITNGERVQLRGETDGGSVSSTATTRFERRDAIPGVDDGLYCIVTMEFTPRYPDPKGAYLLKFVGGNWRWGLVHLGRAPFGQKDRPGYGTSRMTVQTCRSAADPPDKDCPEWGN